VDADVPGSKRVLRIGTDNVKAGRERLKRMATLVMGKGSIAVITISGQHSLDDRVAGVANLAHKRVRMEGWRPGRA
jgi:ribose transport system substrate-binding protein